MHLQGCRACNYTARQAKAAAAALFLKSKLYRRFLPEDSGTTHSDGKYLISICALWGVRSVSGKRFMATSLSALLSK